VATWLLHQKYSWLIMRLVIVLLLCCLLYNITNAQKFALAFPRFNIAYPYIDNPIDCVVEGYPKSSIVLLADKGEVIKSSNGRFIFRPHKGGLAIITVKVKVGNKLRTIGTYPVRVKAFPEPTPMVGTISSGNISKDLLIAMGGLRAILLDAVVCGVPFAISSFSVVALRNSEYIFGYKNIGPSWENPLVDKIKRLQPGDTFIIYQITCTPPNDDDIILQPLIYTITEKDNDAKAIVN
jgi:hypothetical protein